MSDVIDREAHHKIDTHEKLCAERYGAVWSALQDIKRDMSNDRTARASTDAIIHTRFNTISTRMWAAVAGTAAASVVGLCAVAFYMITKGKL